MAGKELGANKFVSGADEAPNGKAIASKPLAGEARQEWVSGRVAPIVENRSVALRARSFGGDDRNSTPGTRVMQTGCWGLWSMSRRPL